MGISDYSGRQLYTGSPASICLWTLSQISLMKLPLPYSQPCYFEWNRSYAPLQRGSPAGLNHSSEQWWLAQERAHIPIRANEREAILRLVKSLRKIPSFSLDDAVYECGLQLPEPSGCLKEESGAARELHARADNEALLKKLLMLSLEPVGLTWG